MKVRTGKSRKRSDTNWEVSQTKVRTGKSHKRKSEPGSLTNEVANWEVSHPNSSHRSCWTRNTAEVLAPKLLYLWQFTCNVNVKKCQRALVNIFCGSTHDNSPSLNERPRARCDAARAESPCSQLKRLSTSPPAILSSRSGRKKKVQPLKTSMKPRIFLHLRSSGR